MSRDEVILQDILGAISAIETATAGGHGKFMQSALIQDAVLYRLVVIGEAVTRLSLDLKAAHPRVDWRGISILSGRGGNGAENRVYLAHVGGH